MRRYLLEKAIGFLVSALLFLFGGGCTLSFDEGGGGYAVYGPYDSGEDETEDLLLVSGSGETLVFEYNTLTFSARLNWQDGNYYFAPDPDGTISGHRIVCLATISEYEVEGDCFRDQRVCHFRFYESWTESEDKDAYELSESSCKTAASVGPFLVPLESPICGEDPFPACPSDDIFPDGPAQETDDPSDPEEEVPPYGSAYGEVDPQEVSPIDRLIDGVCAAVARCDPSLTEGGCLLAMNGDAGRQLWDDFGLTGHENEFTTDQVASHITHGSIAVNTGALEDCLEELDETCDNEGEAVSLGSYLNVENLIAEDGVCPAVLEISGGGDL